MKKKAKLILHIDEGLWRRYKKFVARDYSLNEWTVKLIKDYVVKNEEGLKSL